MVKKRRQFTAGYKFNVALEAVEGSKTFNQTPLFQQFLLR